MKIIKGASSLKEFLPLLKGAFHENFPSLLPKLYADETYLSNHYLARDDNNNLMGVMASIPSTYIIGEYTLNARGVGMVGVKKSARGKGVMNALMTEAVADARKENVDYMFLSGNRKRYERYGFVPCNYLVSFTVTKENIKHSEPSVQLDFEKYDKKKHLDAIKQIYENQFARYERKDMHKTIIGWNNKKITVAKLNDKIVGYCIVKNLTINELAIDGVSAKDFVINYFNKLCRIPLLYVQSYDIEQIKSLATLAQYVKAVDECSICIINYWNVIHTLLSAYPNKGNYEYVIEIENNGRKLITAHEGKINISDTDKSPQCYLHCDIATMALFSPAIAYAYGIPFVLKLSVTHNDNV